MPPPPPPPQPPPATTATVARAPGTATGQSASAARPVDALANELSEATETDDTLDNLRKTFAGIFGNV